MNSQESEIRSAEVLRQTGRLEIRRSARRKKTVQARMNGDAMLLYVPDRLNRAQEDEWAVKMWNQIHKRRRTKSSDEDLMARARRLSDQYLDGKAVPASVRWVDNQTMRWGSTSTRSGDIRLSDRLQRMPSWLTDSVLVHELAHLLEASHNARFHTLVDRYPYTSRSRDFLAGFSYGAAWGTEGRDQDDQSVEEPAG